MAACGRAQQPAMPVVAFVRGGSPDARRTEAFRNGLAQAGVIEGQNVRVEYHWLEDQYDRVPSLIADLIRRGVAVIATPGSNPAALAAKSATATIPIVFGVGDDPVRLGLVTSLARPGGNATGVNFFDQEVTTKRLGLLHELVPKAARIAVLVNPANASTAEATLRNMPEAARTLGLQIAVFKASASREIEAAFNTLTRDRADALFVAGDAFFTSRRVQFATLATRQGMPALYPVRDFVEVGGLMSYSTDLLDMHRQVGAMTGQILKGRIRINTLAVAARLPTMHVVREYVEAGGLMAYGPNWPHMWRRAADLVDKILRGAKPTDIPVEQPAKFDLVINLTTAKALGLQVPDKILTLADEVIE
jgi:putative ABC transport system substrate-binding protein